MSYICYTERKFAPGSMALITQADSIIAEYAAQGYDLTLRQLYYQFVARGLIPNRDTEYKRLGSIINDARLAGLIDWDAIVDRTRNLSGNSHWSNPNSVIQSAAECYAIDKWADQPYRPEVWVEKEALAGVVERACRSLDVSFFSCRGYVSQSEMHAAGLRLEGFRSHGQEPVIIHLGDHDPSGIDMSRDILDRLDLFVGDVRVDRIALNWDQIEQYRPPPNPAKLTDSRCAGYMVRFGDESWELDALDPATLGGLIENAVLGLREDDLWDEAVARETRERHHLTLAARDWGKVVGFLDEQGESE